MADEDRWSSGDVRRPVGVESRYVRGTTVLGAATRRCERFGPATLDQAVSDLANRTARIAHARKKFLTW